MLHLAFCDQLFFVALGRVSGDLARPEGDAHNGVRTSHDAKRQEVDQDCHTHVVSGI